MALHVAYVNDPNVVKVPKSRRQTEKQLLHELALATIAEMRVKNKQKARALFAGEWAELEKRKQELSTKTEAKYETERIHTYHLRGERR